MEKQFDRIPEHLKPQNHGTDALFTNGWMEKLTRTHISIPVIMHLSIVGYVSYLALQQHNVVPFVLFFAAGLLTWTFAEYWVHRYIYHVKTQIGVAKGEWKPQNVSRVDGVDCRETEP